MKPDSMKPLLVGEDNPWQTDPIKAQRYALYPLPQHSAGGRLCALIMQMTVKEYISKFDRANLCSGKWSVKEARKNAAELLHDRGPGSHVDYGRGQHDLFAFFGAKVCAAFGVAYEPFTVKCIPTGPAREVFAAILPHPSGRCRLWNEVGAFDRARETLQRAGVLSGGRGTSLWDTPADPNALAWLKVLKIPPTDELDAIAKRVVGAKEKP